MNGTLAKYRRVQRLSLLLVLLLFGNELLHLHCHEHPCGTTGDLICSVGAAPGGASVLSADRRLTAVSAEERFCPFCSPAIDLSCPPVSIDPQFEVLPSTVVRRDPTPPAFRISFSHQPRSPPQV